MFIVVYGVAPDTVVKAALGPDGSELRKVLAAGSILLSGTAEQAWRQTATFFFDRELRLPENANSKWLPLLSTSKGLLSAMAIKQLPIATAAVLTSGCRERDLHRVFGRIARTGFEIKALRLATLTAEQLAALQSGAGDAVTPPGPVWMLALSRINAVKAWDDVIGAAPGSESDGRLDAFDTNQDGVIDRNEFKRLENTLKKEAMDAAVMEE